MFIYFDDGIIEELKQREFVFKGSIYNNGEAHINKKMIFWSQSGDYSYNFYYKDSKGPNNEMLYNQFKLYYWGNSTPYAVMNLEIYFKRGYKLNSYNVYCKEFVDEKLK